MCLLPWQNDISMKFIRYQCELFVAMVTVYDVSDSGARQSVYNMLRKNFRATTN